MISLATVNCLQSKLFWFPGKCGSVDKTIFTSQAVRLGVGTSSPQEVVPWGNRVRSFGIILYSSDSSDSVAHIMDLNSHSVAISILNTDLESIRTYLTTFHGLKLNANQWSVIHVSRARRN